MNNCTGVYKNVNVNHCDIVKTFNTINFIFKTQILQLS